MTSLNGSWKPRRQTLRRCYARHVETWHEIGQASKCEFDGVSDGSHGCLRWDQYHIIPQLAEYIPLIYHFYIANWVIIYHLPPIKGTRKQLLMRACLDISWRYVWIWYLWFCVWFETYIFDLICALCLLFHMLVRLVICELIIAEKNMAVHGHSGEWPSCNSLASAVGGNLSKKLRSSRWSQRHFGHTPYAGFLRAKKK